MITTAKKGAAKSSKSATKPATLSGLAELPIDAIEPHPANPRTDVDQAELEQLAESVKTHGILQPVIVRSIRPSRYQLIAGGRRLAAAKAAGLKKVPVSIRKADDAEALSLALVENLERSDLNPVETARAIARSVAPESKGGCGMSHIDAGVVMSRDASWIRRQIQLLKLPEVWLKQLASGDINTGHGAYVTALRRSASVLACIEDDMLANPWTWCTVDDFERNAKLRADEATLIRRRRRLPNQNRCLRPPSTAEPRQESRTANESHPAAKSGYVPTVEYAATSATPATTWRYQLRAERLRRGLLLPKS